ncbi:hypothetical protein [Microbispora sp. CSR-4]|uniref:hypothetical protein n=1 Tax=Microbispora sp. CSR-4 TaxID=2592813 RepID=UPI0011CC02A2|nr:hypothetical protein [Microbispora sp. CSR-4]
MDNLAKLVGTVREFAGTAAMTLVPAVPEADLGSEICLGPETLDLPAFLEIAGKHGGGLLYLQAAPFDPDGDEHQVGDLPAHLVKRKGQVGQVSVAFAAAGVVHFWEHRAAWYVEWQQLAKAEPSRKDYLHDDGEGDLSEQERAQLSELRTALLANPDFRAARGTARRRIADAVSEEFDGWSWRVINAVCAEADELGREQYDQLYARIDDLAEELAADPEFQRTRTAAARKHVADRFVLAQAGGLSGPLWVPEELYARAQELAKAATKKQAPGLF